MKIFVCLLVVAVSSCKAGFESGHDNGGGNGLEDSNGYQYLAPSSGGQDFSGHGHELEGQDHQGQNDYTLALTQGQNHGQNFDFGHGQHNFDMGHGPVLNNFGGDSYLQAAHDLGNQQLDGHQEVSAPDGGYAVHEGAGQNDGHGQGFVLHDGGHDFGDGYNFGNVEASPVGEHIDEEHPVEVPLYKHVTVPIHKPLHINVPKPILIGIPQPYPVKVPVHKPVAVPVETEISIPFEKVVPYPVVKHIPYPVEKHIPIKVEKTVTVHVPQPYPVKIPVYKVIHHKSHH